jgi:hypothetical protein
MWPVLVIVAVLTAATGLLYSLQRMERWLEDSQETAHQKAAPRSPGSPRRGRRVR